ncbi:unnamed protein product [Discosporangium mesarthrocarpum]
MCSCAGTGDDFSTTVSEEAERLQLGDCGEVGKQCKDMTLVFCKREMEPGRKEILLGRKKRGFGEGKWNGFGGKVELGETVRDAACRELVEESNLKAEKGSLARRGLLIFHVPSYPEIMRVHVFEVLEFSGSATETEEMLPKWFAEECLPLEVMWADDRHWMPLFLSGKHFKGEFHFSDESTILSHTLTETQHPPEVTQVCF